MKRRIKFTVKNVILMCLLAINVLVFIFSVASLDIEQMWIPFVTGAISFGYVALFYFSNEDLINELYG